MRQTMEQGVYIKCEKVTRWLSEDRNKEIKCNNKNIAEQVGGSVLGLLGYIPSCEENRIIYELSIYLRLKCSERLALQLSVCELVYLHVQFYQGR